MNGFARRDKPGSVLIAGGSPSVSVAIEQTRTAEFVYLPPHYINAVKSRLFVIHLYYSVIQCSPANPAQAGEEAVGLADLSGLPSSFSVLVGE